MIREQYYEQLVKAIEMFKTQKGVELDHGLDKFAHSGKFNNARLYCRAVTVKYRD